MLAGLIATLEVVLLGWLWFGPALAVHSVDVTGTRHLTPAEVTRDAGLDGASSIISVDGEAARQRLMEQVWVRSASVQPELGGKVVVHVSEWQPIAAYHAGTSTKLFLLSSQAVVLTRTATPAGLLVVQGPGGGDPHVGDRAIDPELLTVMVNMQRVMPTLIGQDVASFVFDSCGDLTMVAKRGWKVYFGRVLTPEEYAALRDKLTALRAISGQVSYSSTDLDYVNLMNPSEPAVGYKSLATPPPTPPPGATPPPNPCK